MKVLTRSCVDKRVFACPDCAMAWLERSTMEHLFAPDTSRYTWCRLDVNESSPLHIILRASSSFGSRHVLSCSNSVREKQHHGSVTLVHQVYGLH